MRPRLQPRDRPDGPGNGQLEQRRRQVAGLAILAIVILVFSIWRAGLGAVFPTGWWRFW